MRPIVWVALVLVLVIGGLLTVKTVTNRSYYVGISHGKVAIFQGVPVKVGGAQLSHVEQPTPISTGDVAAWFIPRLQQGIRAKSMEDARRIIAQQIPGAPGRSIPQILAGSPSPSASPSPSPSRSRTK
jgi:protein phosphatase